VTRLAARRVLHPDGSLRPAVVVVDGTRIAAVEPPGPDDDPADVTLSPGLVDLQVNGFGDHDVWSEPSLEPLGRRLAASGTTAWCPTLTSRHLPEYGAWLAAHPAPGFGEVGLHLEGPFLSVAGAHRREALRPPDLPWLAALPPRIRIVTLAPELPGGLDAVGLLTERGVAVALGHSGATFEEATAAADRGARLVTHVFNAMTALGHRAPGLAGAALTDRRLTPMVIGDGVHVHPAVLGLVLGGRSAIVVSDAVAWHRSGLEVVAGAARLADGTIAGSVVTLAGAVRVAVLGAGVALETALMAATAVPAGVLGLADRGRLVPGSRADLVAFGPDLSVAGVWVGGEALGPAPEV
jgi:N-acetylglucosamine-6-phosphate deacetylase